MNDRSNISDAVISGGCLGVVSGSFPAILLPLLAVTELLPVDLLPPLADIDMVFDVACSHAVFMFGSCIVAAVLGGIVIAVADNNAHTLIANKAGMVRMILLALVAPAAPILSRAFLAVPVTCIASGMYVLLAFLPIAVFTLMFGHHKGCC